MEKFKNIKSIPAFISLMNIDTDKIIHKQFLKTIKRSGLGKSLFYEMRFDEKGNPIKGFILDQEPFNNSKILITGNNGYIGTVLSPLLEDLGHDVTWFDNNFFEDCNLCEAKAISKQIIKDIRNISLNDLQDIDIVIHLAALSNDPLGEFLPKLTEDINYLSTLKLAKLSKQIGVKKFIYISSQSMYGILTSQIELDEEKSEKNHLQLMLQQNGKQKLN